MNKLERRFGRYAIANLMVYIVGTEGVAFLLAHSPNGARFIEQLQFVPALILRGEVWRLISFVFIPPGYSIWVVFILYFYYFLGTRLEQEWGDFRFNIYYLTGMVATVLAGFLTGQSIGAGYLNLSLFLAFATIDPDYSILLFFVLPVKVKYLGWLAWLAVAASVVVGSWSSKVLVLVAILNYFLFFGRDIALRWKGRAASYPRRRAFKAQISQSQAAVIHKCAVCGMTEKDDPRMDFRYCTQCRGHYEYCMPHLKTHEHRME
ncbi:MAG TPA: rhomboid family intramembrane serine protease [Acidiferrobacter sp.]|nr:rhomboid family intramembrane serine protease [Acidiferrobacter sp.]